jgi:O-acetyl-ADP-ribose deacetylase (regulator of RNase III)
MTESRPFNRTVLRVLKDDITTLDVEAFVFYARTDLALGAGFGNAIAQRGGPSIKRELDQIGRIRPTEAVVTSAGRLRAKYIVHAAGPAFQEEDLEQKLRATIMNVLRIAEDKNITQLAFPAMGAGFYGIPLPACAEVMVRTITEYLANDTNIREVIFCANDAREYQPFHSRLAMLGGQRVNGRPVGQG